MISLEKTLTKARRALAAVALLAGLAGGAAAGPIDTRPEAAGANAAPQAALCAFCWD